MMPSVIKAICQRTRCRNFVSACPELSFPAFFSFGVLCLRRSTEIYREERGGGGGRAAAPRCSCNKLQPREQYGLVVSVRCCCCCCRGCVAVCVLSLGGGNFYATHQSSNVLTYSCSIPRSPTLLCICCIHTEGALKDGCTQRSRGPRKMGISEIPRTETIGRHFPGYTRGIGVTHSSVTKKPHENGMEVQQYWY